MCGQRFSDTVAAGSPPLVQLADGEPGPVRLRADATRRVVVVSREDELRLAPPFLEDPSDRATLDPVADGMGSARPRRLEKQPRVLRVCGGEAGEEEIVGAAGILEIELLRRTLDVEPPVLGYRWPEPEDASDPPDPAPRQPRRRVPGR